MTGTPTEHHGFFVTLDGPGGAGKTTTAGRLTRLLTARGYNVHATTEPSRAVLGEIARSSGDVYRDYALACLVAADRYHHLATEIRPAIATGRIVVCDRYVPSSYVLQRMDGVPIEFIEALNAEADRPGLTVILTANPYTTAARIDTRGTRHRFETGHATSAQEAKLYEDTARRLTKRGWSLLAVDTTTLPPGDVVERIAEHLTRMVEIQNPGPSTR